MNDPAALTRARADLYESGEVADHAALRLHLVAVHRNAAALDLDMLDAVHEHSHEHTGPGTIRNHARDSLHWNLEDVRETLAEAAAPATPAPSCPPTATPDIVLRSVLNGVNGLPRELGTAATLDVVREIIARVADEYGIEL